MGPCPALQDPVARPVGSSSQPRPRLRHPHPRAGGQSCTIRCAGITRMPLTCSA